MEKDLLLELGTEEIPARFINSTKISMKEFLEKKLNQLRISFKDINIKSTPRRFAILITDLATKQKEEKEEIKGPSKKISFDENNNPTKALNGFLKSKGASLNDITFKTIGNEEYVYVTTILESKETTDFLKEIFEEMIKSLVFPKPMKWGNNKIKFIRPIRWILCLFGDEVPQLNMFNLNASNITKGHRFLGKSEIKINKISEYEEKLKENFVILDDEVRKETIRKQIENIAKELNGTYLEDEDLLDEINYIIEYPTALYGDFKEDYLKLPKEAIITPMKEHQRYFPVLDKNGNLLNKFITVRNGDSYKIENVKKGNEKVLDARLSDAKFFYEEDTKNNLETYVDKLKTIVFHESLGTMYNKMERLIDLSEDFAKILNSTFNVNINDLKRAAKLCKADLNTAMVFEFSELQGVMGKYYALVSNEKEEIANAIYEHYLPKFATDNLPKSNLGITLSLMDKLDSICGFFAANIKPTGAKDPYGLRRLALGVLKTISENKIDVNLKELIKITLDHFTKLNDAKIINLDFNYENTLNEILAFMKQREKNILLDKNIRYDVVDSILDGELNSYRMDLKSTIVENFVNNKENLTYLESFNRVLNLTKDKTLNKIEINPNLFTEIEETNLYNKVNSIKDKIYNFNINKQYEESLNLLTSIKPEIDNFFDKVMIMVDDEKIKENRLSLVFEIKYLLNSIANFSKIVE